MTVSDNVVRSGIRLVFVFLMILPLQLKGQSLPAERKSAWHLAGVRDTGTQDYTLVLASDHGLIANGESPNDSALEGLLQSFKGIPIIIQFEPGIFLFQKEIFLPSRCVIRGRGADLTQLKINHAGSGNGIVIRGEGKQDESTELVENSEAGSSLVKVNSTDGFDENDWVQFVQDDEDLMNNDWAYGSYGQITRIRSIQGNKISLHDSLRLMLTTEREAKMVRISMLEGSGIECLQIRRMDNTAPEQNSTIHMEYAANCWIKGVRSDSCTYAHVRLSGCSRIGICQSYFEHGFEYGPGGRAYGIAVEFTSGDCRIENNIFHHLRHALLCQAGANGNVFAYNACFTSFWDSVSLPSDAAGDIVLHGNYPFFNLFEQNLCQNIVIDNSHGANGPNNTLLRNRAEKWGIFFSDTNSPGQAILGNEITNTQFPYSLVNYRILGDGHYVYGNLVRGSIQPVGTGDIADSSFAYSSIPSFINKDQWVSYGLPRNSLDGQIPSGMRWNKGTELTYCFVMQTIDSIPNALIIDRGEEIILYPNPAFNRIQVNSSRPVTSYRLLSMEGKLVQEGTFDPEAQGELSLPDGHGVYLVELYFEDGSSQTFKILKVAR